jgi:hypothetical protein
MIPTRRHRQPGDTAIDDRSLRGAHSGAGPGAAGASQIARRLGAERDAVGAD